MAKEIPNVKLASIPIFSSVLVPENLIGNTRSITIHYYLCIDHFIFVLFHKLLFFIFFVKRPTYYIQFQNRIYLYGQGHLFVYKSTPNNNFRVCALQKAPEKCYKICHFWNDKTQACKLFFISVLWICMITGCPLVSVKLTDSN